MPQPSTALSRRSLFGLAGVTAAAGLVSRRAAAQPAATDPGDLQGGGFYRLRMGELEVSIVSDGSFPFGDPGKILALNATADEVAAALEHAFLAPSDVRGQVNTLLVRSPAATVLVDTGCGTLFGPTTGKLVTNLARLGVTPADIDAVVITHAHGDHVGGLISGPAAGAFTKARFFASRREHEFWTAATPDMSRSALPEEMRKDMVKGANAAFDAVKDRLELVGHEDQIAPGVHALLLGGHTPGHLGLHVAGGDRELLYVTDLVHHVAFGMPNPEWRVAYDVDPAEGSKVRRATLERLASDRALIAGAHLPFPAFGHVRKAGQGFEFAPAIWQW